MAGVQFFGIPKVMEMFDSRKVSAWSIWHGKEFQFKGYGDGELRAVLDALQNSFNDPIYTLRIYEDITDPEKIKSNTPHDGSFNFKINVPMEMPGMGIISGNSNYQLVKRIEELEKQNKELLDQEEFDDEPETIGSVMDTAIIEIIKDPEKAMTWLDVIKGIFNPGYQAPVRPQLHSPAPASIGNINTTSVITPQLSMEEKTNRLYVAIEELDKRDPKLVEHIEKLAAIAIKSPGQFKGLLTILDTMK